jgi:hypothetical protein
MPFSDKVIPILLHLEKKKGINQSCLCTPETGKCSTTTYPVGKRIIDKTESQE